MKRASIVAGWMILVAHAAVASDANWRLDQLHTQIEFAVDHQGFAATLGLIKLTDGVLRFDPDAFDHCELDVRINAGSVLLGDAKWEQIVTSWRFLNAERWPQIRYTARQCEQTGPASGIVHGQLSLHGQTASVDLNFKLNKVGNDPYTFKHSAGFSAQAQLQRSAFGMDKMLSAVGDTVSVRLEVLAVRDRDASLPAPATESTEVNTQMEEKNAVEK